MFLLLLSNFALAYKPEDLWRLENGVESSRRDLAYGASSQRPTEDSRVQCQDFTWWDDGAADEAWDCFTWESQGDNGECGWDYDYEWRNYGFTVDEACCACGGGIRKYGCSPAVENWHDSYGEEYTCDWYAAYPGACDRWGYDFEWSGHTAHTACCACGGGNIGVWDEMLSGRRQLLHVNESESAEAALRHAHHLSFDGNLTIGEENAENSRRQLDDVSESNLTTILTKMNTAFTTMFPESASWTNSANQKAYNFARFTGAFEHMFGSFEWDKSVPDPSCTDCFTGNAMTKQTKSKADIIKRVVAFLWAHVKHETGGLVYLKEASCQDDVTDDVCCSYNTGTCATDTASNDKYFGRGSLQLSWKSNYEAFAAWTNDQEDEGLHASALNNFVGRADKLVSPTFAWLSGMWYFQNANMHLCATQGTESIVNCFQRTTKKINGDQECANDSSQPNADMDKTRLKYLIEAYQALNGDSSKGIPKSLNGDADYYNSLSEIPTKLRTCDFCAEDSDNYSADCTNEDAWHNK